MSSGVLVQTISTGDNPAYAVAWSPDGKELVSGEAGLLQVRDAATGAVRLSINAHPYATYGVAWSPDGRLLASAGADSTAATWDAKTGAIGQRFTTTEFSLSVLSVGFSPDSKRLVTGARDGEARLYDLGTGALVWTAP